MAFPQTPLATTVELLIDGAWQDITPDVYLRDSIVITRGRSANGSAVDPSQCTLTLNNRDGRYSPRNPAGPLYGKIGRNTPLRVSVNAGANALELSGDVESYVWTPDVAPLDISGDLDIQFDATLTNWLSPAPGTLDTTVLMSKLGPTGNKSWFFAVSHYRLYFEWSSDGTTTLSATATIPLDIGPGARMAVRATLKANNGSGGRTVTFYTADKLGATWRQLGDPVVQSGVTSIFNSNADIEIGAESSFVFTAARGRIHAVRVLNGINGPGVANPDFSAQPSGTASFTDPAGRTWTLNGNATVTSRKVRFVGEVAEWPVSWDVSGRDVYTQVSAAGILRRLNQGATPIKSTLTRRIPSLGPVAYWPMEESGTATVAHSPIPGVTDMQAVGLTWGGADTLPGSSALPTVATAGSIIKGRVPAETATSWHVEFVYSLSTITGNLHSLMNIDCAGGTVASWSLQLKSGTARILGTDINGATVVDDSWAVGSDLYDGRWVRWQFALVASGTTVQYGSKWVSVGGDGGLATSSYTGKVGTVTSVHTPDGGFHADLAGMALGHVSVFAPMNLTAYDDVDVGLRGETSGVRLARLGGEESIPLIVSGDPSAQAQVGAQRPDTILSVLGQCADADQGILYEQRDALGLLYRDRRSLMRQPVRLALNYATPGHVAPPFVPSDDDQAIRNEVTVSRTGGASAVATQTTGPLSTQPPPAGVGRYQDAREVNVYSDDQPSQLAAWAVYLGTWDEARYPSVHVDLAAGAALIDDVCGVDVGDRATVTGLPAWLPPDLVDLQVQGYAETISAYDWDLTFACTPGGPWSHLGAVGSSRADTAGSSVHTAVSATATALTVDTAQGPVWVDSARFPAAFPFDVIVSGERMTVTAITGTTSPQVFTVVRAVNGISKPQAAGAAVRLFAPAYVAL